MKQNGNDDDKDSEKKNPFIPSVKPSDIIEKSTKTSGDWLTKGIEKKEDTDQTQSENESDE